MKIKKLIDSFNYAIEGIIHAVRSQRNMKIHMITALLVLFLCFFYDLKKAELLIVTLTIAMVLTAELINTAIEAAIDATTNFYHPLAKIAKNVAAGAVLITAVNAVFVGFIIFWDKLVPFTYSTINKIKNSNPYAIFIILVIVFILTIIIKALFGEGTPLKGGFPSGHAAISFAIATIIALLSENPLVILLSYLLAFIVAESRVDSDVHTVFEVAVGAVYGTLISILLMKIFI